MVMQFVRNKMGNTSSSGIGFFGLLTILFIGLKLTHYVDWTWWVVLLPLWGPLLFLILVVLIIMIATIIIAVFNE